MEKYIIGMLVRNHFGVLTRLSGLIARRGFNIDSLTVGVTADPNLSRMTVALSGDEYSKEQIVKQLAKQEAVVSVKIMDSHATAVRELVMIKVAVSAESRQQLMDAANIFRAKIIDFAMDSLCMEITGDTEKLTAFVDLMKPYGILEMCRTGAVALDRGTVKLSAD